MGSIHTRSQYFFPITLFLFFPSFFALLHFFFPLLFCPPLFLPPLSPAFFPFSFSYSFPIAFLSFSYSCFLFSSPFCCFSFSFLPFLYSPDFFLLFPSSLFLIVFVFVFSFSPLNFFLVSPLYQRGCYEHKG